MPYIKKTENPEIVTPPTPLPVPSPTYETETGERYTAQGEVITAPRNRYTGDTHAEIPEYEGSYFVTENGTIPCGGYEMISDLVVNVEPKGLTKITITENGTYKPTEYDGYSQVVVNVQPNLTALIATENKTYTPTAPVQGFSSVTVNVPVGGNTLKTLLDATKNARYLFYNYHGNTATDLISYDDTSEVVDMSYMFNWSTVVSIPLLNTSKVTNINYMFNNANNLVEIPAFDFSNVTEATNAFGAQKIAAIHATGMKISFNISASTQFTEAALVEILTNLADQTGGTTRTLTMGQTNLDKLTQAEKDIALNKNWTLA